MNNDSKMPYAGMYYFVGTWISPLVLQIPYGPRALSYRYGYGF